MAFTSPGSAAVVGRAEQRFPSFALESSGD